MPALLLNSEEVVISIEDKNRLNSMIRDIEIIGDYSINDDIMSDENGNNNNPSFQHNYITCKMCMNTGLQMQCTIHNVYYTMHKT